MKTFNKIREEMSHDKDWGKPGSTRHAKKITPGETNEGTWAIPKTPKDKAALKKLMSQPIKLGKEGDEAAGKIYSLIGDDELFDDLYVAGKKNPNGDARPIIKKHMKRLKISEAKDPNEYDKEGEMMKTQLKQIDSAIDKLMGMIGDDDNLPEWVQNKMTKATDYIRSVRDYLEAENDDDDDEKEMDESKLDEISPATMARYHTAADKSKSRAWAMFDLGKSTAAAAYKTQQKRTAGQKLARKKIQQKAFRPTKKDN